MPRFCVLPQISGPIYLSHSTQLNLAIVEINQFYGQKQMDRQDLIVKMLHLKINKLVAMIKK